MSEMEILRRCLLKATKIGARLFRLNSGMGWIGKVINHTSSAITIQYPRPLHCGFKGAADTYGWFPVEITESMVGKTLAVFAAIEIKSKTGKTTKEQDNFLKVVTDSGGIAFVARSEMDVDNGIREYIKRITGSVQKSCEKSRDSSEGITPHMDPEWEV